MCNLKGVFCQTMVQQVFEKSNHGESIIENTDQKPKAQDVWAALVFILNTIAFIAVSIFTYSSANWSIIEQGNADPANGTPNSLGNPFSGAGIASIIVSFLISILLTYFYLKLMQHKPEQLIKFSFWFYFVFLLISTIIMFVVSIVIAIINLIFLGLFVWMWFGIRHQIPFLAALLSTVAKVTRKYPALIWTVLMGDIISLIWSAFSAGAFMSFYVKFALSIDSKNQIVVDQHNPAFIILVIYGLFSSYWVMNVLRYLVHVCVCGVYATFYFLSDNMPQSPTMASIKRGLTTSFGSVCFGALVITAVQVLRTLLNIARQNSDNIVMYFLLCCLECLVSCLEGLIEFFNYYAFTQVVYE